MQQESSKHKKVIKLRLAGTYVGTKHNKLRIRSYAHESEEKDFSTDGKRRIFTANFLETGLHPVKSIGT
jgi:hypothetical protein